MTEKNSTQEFLTAASAQALSVKQRIQIGNRRRLLRRGGVVLPLVCFAVLFALMFCIGRIESNSAASAKSPDGTPNGGLQLTFLGDVMMGRYIGQMCEKTGYDRLFSGISGIWSNSDHVFANFDSPVRTGDTSGYEKRLDGIPLIASEAAVLSMQAAGIDVVGFANNHCFDYGKAGYDNSRAFFDSIGLTHAGSIPDETQPGLPPYTVITAEDGRKIGFIAITSVYSSETAHGGVLTTNHFMLYRYITASAQANDLTVVYLHSGNEYTAILDDKQQDVAHSIIDAGADMVIGSHPHNVQPVELYGNGIIFYSLGNFIMDQSNTFTRDGIIVQYNESADGKRSFETIPIRIEDGCPRVTTNSFYTRRINRILTKLLDSESYTETEAGHIVIELPPKKNLQPNAPASVSNP